MNLPPITGLVADRSAPKMRRCLGWCGKEFLSSWAGHRLCTKCRLRANALKGDGGPAVIKVVTPEDHNKLAYRYR